MDISSLTSDGISSAETLRDQGKLKEACDAIEGMFLSILLKQGMQGMLDNAEGHSASALGYALEQSADEMARNGDLGIADNIYQQLSTNL